MRHPFARFAGALVLGGAALAVAADGGLSSGLAGAKLDLERGTPDTFDGARQDGDTELAQPATLLPNGWREERRSIMKRLPAFRAESATKACTSDRRAQTCLTFAGQRLVSIDVEARVELDLLPAFREGLGAAKEARNLAFPFVSYGWSTPTYDVTVIQKADASSGDVRVHTQTQRVTWKPPPGLAR